MAVTLREYFVEHPNLGEQFSPKNNDSILDRTIGSNVKAWWWCEKYQCDYEMPIFRKVQRPDSCSVCNGSKVFPGFNDFETVKPDMAKEWDYERNNISPSEVKFSSSRRFWFVCSTCGSSFDGSLSQRVYYDSGCPKCGHETRIRGVTGKQLVSDVPSMANMFQGSIYPTMDSRRVVDWACSHGHTWRQSPHDFAGCPWCLGERITVTNDDGQSFELRKPAGATVADNEAMLQLFSVTNSIPANFLSDASAQVVEWTCDKNHSWCAPVYSVKKSVAQKTNGCPQCGCMVSTGEIELASFVRKILPGVDVRVNDRQVIPPKELDIYIPDLGVAIEYNGVLWHSEKYSGRDSHNQKLQLCEQQGIQLLVVWEDDWLYRRSIVENMLQHKLRVSTQRTIPARSTQLENIDSTMARVFCDTNHIQGFVPGTFYMGLYDNMRELVAVSIWRKNKSTLYLERYCTNNIVVGGMGKFLKHAIMWAKQHDIQQIVTFSDNTVSQGDLYRRLGFTQDKKLKPDYSYLVHKKRVHKFNYRKKRFREDPHLVYQDGLTETELAELNNLPRIYDYGKTRWVITLE